MRRLYLLCLFAFSMASAGNAQSPPVVCPGNTQPLPVPFCSQACIVDYLDGYTGRNQWFPQWDVPPQFCAPLFHSINWVGFTAGTPQLTLRIQTYNCELPQRTGLQAGIFGTLDCSSFIQVSNCVPQFYDETLLTAQGLIPGRAYYLVIDGNEGDICEFEVQVVSGSTQAQPVFGDPVIIGPDSLCAGRSGFYEVQGFGGGAGYFNWELDGAPIGQEQFVIISGLAPGTYELCANPGNPAYGYDTTICKIIEVIALPAIAIDETVCIEDLPFTYQGYSFTASGTYSFNTITPDGCEQAVELELTVIDLAPPTLVNAAICPGDDYFIGNQVFRVPGSYLVVLTAQNGCDSLVQLILLFRPPSISVLGDVVAPLPFLVGNIEIDTTGDFAVTLTSQYGCDSIVVGTLIALSPDTLFTDTTICQGDTVFYNMQSLTSSGVYLDTLINMDTATIQQLTLTVIPVGSDTLAASICEGNSLIFGGVDYTQSGLYCDTIPGGGANGCDSICCLNLTVLPNDTTFLDTAICMGESIIIGNNLYTAPGQYTDVTTAVNGCDSIIVITLEVLPIQETFLNEQICEGETYPLGGAEYSQPGQYMEFFPSSTSCDSVVTLNLSVIPVVETELDTTLCPGQALHVGPYVFREPFQAELQFTSANGCDSILHLALSYRDTIRVDTFAVEPDGQDFFGGSIYVELAGGTPPYSYLWSDGRTEPFIDFLPSGRYFLTAADAHCSQGFLFKVPLRDEFGSDPIILRPGNGGSGIAVSPNPFSQELKVQLTGIDEGRPVRLLLYNFAGQLVHKEQALGINHRLRLQAPAGVYWLVAEQEGIRLGVERVVCGRR